MFGRSQGLRALRQCREGVGLSTEQWCGDNVGWYGGKCGDGVEMVVYQSQDRNLALEREWGGMCVGMALKLDQLLLLCT